MAQQLIEVEKCIDTRYDLLVGGAVNPEKDPMKLREMYSSWLLVSGLICWIMGIGNWTVGAIETSKYQALLYKTARTGLEESYRNFQELDHQKNEEVLRRINDDREKFNGARVKLNFFYVVLTGGRVLFFLGAIMSLLAVVRLIRHDSRIKIRRLSKTEEPAG